MFTPKKPTFNDAIAKPQAPAPQMNWLVTVIDADKLATTGASIQRLYDKAGKLGYTVAPHPNKRLGMLLITCDDGMIEKIKQLPNVCDVNANRSGVAPQQQALRA